MLSKCRKSKAEAAEAARAKLREEGDLNSRGLRGQPRSAGPKRLPERNGLSVENTSTLKVPKPRVESTRGPTNHQKPGFFPSKKHGFCMRKPLFCMVLRAPFTLQVKDLILLTLVMQKHIKNTIQEGKGPGFTASDWTCRD